MSASESQPSVAITFDCTPLRGVSRLDIPLDASPVFRKRLEHFQRAVAKHGMRNTYYLTNATCTFHFTNNAALGWVQFTIDGTVLTNELDTATVGSDLDIRLEKETCDWLTQPAVEWLALSAKRALEIEFDRYIAAGDLSRAIERISREQAASDAAGGFLGMNL